MNYEEMSDLEINRAVLIAIGLPIIGNINELFVEVNPEQCKVIDYYNNPADMWPIILESGISLINYRGFCYATNNCYETFEPHGLGVADSYFYSKAEDKSKSLRAAAIVFFNDERYGESIMKNRSFLTACSFGLGVFGGLFLDGIPVILSSLVAVFFGVSGIICDTIEKSKQ